MRRFLIRYRLIRMNTSEKSFHLISVRYGGDICVCPVPVCGKTPDEIYAMVRDGGVTPCTLPDVMEDFAFTSKSLSNGCAGG